MSLPVITWKTGFEIELMMPRGRSRADFAARVAARHGGRVERFFHPQSEPSKVPGRPSFDNLTPGFRAIGPDGQTLASFVDDLTLQAGLVKTTPALPGWYRILSDDGRILQLVMRHGDAAGDIDAAIGPLAALFGTELSRHDSGMVRVGDERGISVAIGAPLPGERERPCEVVTAPIETGHGDVLSALLHDAMAEGCTVPSESATHIHFDGAALHSATIMARLVKALSRHGDGLKRLVGFNPNCVRLGRWPDALKALTDTAAFQALDWPEAREALSQVGLSKYCDYNLLNIAANVRSKPTFEVRVLPTSLKVAPLLMAAALFEGVLRWCCASAHDAADVPDNLEAFIGALPLADDVGAYWASMASTMSHGTGA